MTEEKRDERKWYCDIELRASEWKRTPGFGIGKVCNTEVKYDGARCPNSHNHR